VSVIPQTSFPIIVTTLLLATATAADGQQPAPLATGDLRVSGVAVDDDSGVVRRRLGAPMSVDTSGWHYPDLQVFLKAGKVAILSITGPSRATRRGLRVGDSATRAQTLYRPCYADSLIIQVCYNTDDFDERAVTAALRSGHVSRINVGRIIEP
jgi:hypothetical protein